MTASPDEIRRRVLCVSEARDALRRTTIDARASWLAESAKLLGRRAVEARKTLSESTGLSEPMVEWGARTTLETVRVETLTALVAEAGVGRREPIATLSLVLAGNLFTASVRAVVVPLLFGVPVIAKASSRESLFPTMLRDALRETDSSLGASFDVVSFRGGDLEHERALVESGDAISVYGSDETIDAMRSRHPTASFLAHGHGVSAAYCGSRSLTRAWIESTVEALSLDISAYDQRGCLSPQVIYVEESLECSARQLAGRLSDGLEEMQVSLPRGPLPIEVGAEQAQWRGVAEVEGDLWIGSEFAVAVVPPEAVRWSPAYRNVSVVPVSAASNAVEALSKIGRHLKCLGADAHSLAELRARLEARPELCAYVAPLGSMQTPSLDAPADGAPIWHGLFAD